MTPPVLLLISRVSRIRQTDCYKGKKYENKIRSALESIKMAENRKSINEKSNLDMYTNKCSPSRGPLILMIDRSTFHLIRTYKLRTLYTKYGGICKYASGVRQHQPDHMYPVNISFSV